MVDFSHLKAFDVESKTADYTMDAVSVNGKSPILTVLPATDANKPYFNELLRKSGKLKRGAVKASTVVENRNHDRSIYAKHVIKGWSDVLDSSGEQVVFSTDSVSAFLASLPDWLFDELRIFCGDPANFADQLDVEVLAKN